MTAVTDPAMQPETFVCDWRLQMRGAAVLEQPRDLMFDIDDVLFPTMYSIHDLAREAGLHNGDVEPRWSGWEVYKLPDGTPCPPEVYWDLWSDFAARGGYVETPPIDEAAEALRSLYLDGHRIHLVTARGFMAHAHQIRGWTKQWIADWAIPWHTLTFAQDKVAAMDDVLTLAPNPGNACKRYFDFAIDDSPKNWLSLFDAGVESYLLDHAHNADYIYDPGEGCEFFGEYRVPSVPAFAKLVQEASQ